MPPRKRAAPRESKAKSTCKLMCCATPPGAVERIREDLAVYRPGLWAEQNNIGPACTRGLRAAKEACACRGCRPDPKDN